MAFLNNLDSDIISLDLWGGNQTYNKLTKTYRLERDCGIFSNMSTCIFAVFLLETEGYKVDKIELIMREYFLDLDMYEILFEKNDSEINFNDISNEEILFFRENCHPTMCGLGLKDWGRVNSTIENFNLKITNKIVTKFFNPKTEVIRMYEKMKSNNNIIENDYVFIWARRTDKIEETKVPTASTYFEELVNHKLLDYRIFVQTDDPEVIKEFGQLNFNFELFDDIPLTDRYSFHRWISHIDDKDFEERYGLSKLDYVIKMYCVVIFASKSKMSLIYPGNPTTFVPIIKNTFDGFILFKDDKNKF
jgi:hypothetical protein